MNTIEIHCCECGREVQARLTSGEEVYPHRKDLWRKSFYACTRCGNYVGINEKTKKAFGCIPTKELRKARGHLSRLIEETAEKRNMHRSDIYKAIDEHVGKKWFAANTRTVDEVRDVYRFVKQTFGG